jgi:hypothetical protein
VTDQDHDGARSLRHPDEVGCALTNLKWGTRGLLEGRILERLDRIHDERVQMLAFGGSQQRRQRGRRQRADALGVHTQATRAQRDLRDRLFAGHEETVRAVDHQTLKELQYEGGLAYARFARQQYDASAHEAATEHAIHLTDAGCEPLPFGSCSIQGDDRVRGILFGRAGLGRAAPRRTLRTPAEPPGSGVTAFGTQIPTHVKQPSCGVRRFRVRTRKDPAETGSHCLGSVLSF